MDSKLTRRIEKFDECVKVNGGSEQDGSRNGIMELWSVGGMDENSIRKPSAAVDRIRNKKNR